MTTKKLSQGIPTSPGKQKNNTANTFSPKKKPDPLQKVVGQSKDTTSHKYLLAGLLALFLYYILKMNGLIVAIGLVGYFFYGNSSQQEMKDNKQKENNDNNTNEKLVFWYNFCLHCRGYIKGKKGRCSCASRKSN